MATPYEKLLENLKKNTTKKPTTFREASVASRVQYTNPQYSGKSTSKSYKWESELLGGLKGKGVGKNNTEKFDNVTKAMGLSESDARELRRYLDHKEDSQKEIKLNKDGSPSKNQTVPMGQGSKTRGELFDNILGNMNNNAKHQMELQQKKQKQEEKVQESKKKERDGLLGFLDKTAGRASRSAQEAIFGEDFVKKQDDNYKKSDNVAVRQMNNTTSREAKGLLEKGSDITGAILGEIAPYTVGYGVADKALKATKIASKLKNPLVTDLVRGAGAGALVGTGKAVARDLTSDDYGAKDYAKTIGLETLLAGGGDALLGAVGRNLNLKGQLDELLSQTGSSKFDEQKLAQAYQDTFAQKGNPVNVLAPKPTEIPKPFEKKYNLQTNVVSSAPKTFDEADLDFQKEVFDRRQAEEDAFVQAEMAPFDDMLKHSSEADMVWNDSVKKSKDMVEQIKQNYGKIVVPEGNWADWGHEVPVQFRAKRGSNESGIDLYRFAEDEGFSSVDEAVQFLKQIDAESKTKLKDLKPTDDMKIKPEDYDGLVEVARKKFAESDNGKAIDKLIEDLMGAPKNSQSFKLDVPVEKQPSLDPYLVAQKEVAPAVEAPPKPSNVRDYETVQREFDEVGEQYRNAKNDKEAKALEPKLYALGDELEVIRNGEQPKPSLVGTNNEGPVGLKFGNTASEYENTWIAPNDSLADKIRSGKVGLVKKLQGIKTQISSDVQPFYDMETGLAKAQGADLLPDGTFKTESSLYKGLRAIRRATKAAKHSIEKTYKPILMSLEKAGISRVQFDEYVSAVHFNDIMLDNTAKLQRKGDVHTRLQEIERLVQGTNDKKVIATLKKEEAKLVKELDTLEPYTLPAKATPQKVQSVLMKWENNPVMTKAQKDFVKEQRKDMQLLVDAGRFSQEEVDALFKKHPNYVDMGRKHDDYEPSIRVGQKRELGSDKDILNPVDSAIMNRVISYHAAATNRALQRIEKLAKLDGANKYFLKELGPDATENELKNSIRYYVDGVEKRYEIPETLKHAYDNLKTDQADELIGNVLGGINNIIRKGSTGYNLDYIAKTIFRDAQQPLLTSRTGLKPHDVVLGFMDSFMGKNLEKLTGGKFKSYKDVYKDMGGDATGIITMDYNNVHKMTKAMQQGSLGRGWELINPLKAIERLGSAVEHGAKLGEFRSAKRKGYNDEDAMFEAVDVFDFSDAGTSGRKLNKVVTYFNAAIRGNARVLEAAKKPEFWAKGAMYITLPTVGIYATRFAPGVSDEQRTRLRNMPEWKRNLAWHIPIPDSDKIISIPKGHLIAQIFANPVERVLDRVYDDSNKSSGEIAKDTAKDTLNSLMPPTGIAGVSQAAGIIANYDWFMKMNIEDSTMQREPDKNKRYNSYTSELAKKFAPITPLSPAKLDYGIKGLTGTVGRDILDTVDNQLAKGEKRPSKVNSTFQILNPLDSFVDDKTQGTGVADRLYDAKQKGNKEAEGYYNAIRDLNKIIKDVREATDLNPKEKRAQIEELREQQREIGDDALQSGVLKKK